MRGKNRLKIVVGIATAGRRKQMHFTLRQLARQRRLADSVVVCPAAAQDFDDADASIAGSPVLRVEGPRGLTSQRNVIVEASVDADVLVFLDDDFYPAADYIEQVEAMFLADTDIVMATGHPKLDGATGPGIAHDVAVRAVEAMPDVVSDVAPELLPTYGGYGCNMVIRMAAVREHGIRFDESLPLYGWLEDIEFSRRLAPHGKVVASPALRGVHLGTKIGRASGVRLGYSQVANPVYMVRKGTVDARYVYRHVAKNVAKNSLRAFFPEPWVDRRGRLKGNLMALRDLWTGRIDPRKILHIF